MESTVVKVAVQDGDRVSKGDLLLVLEAMKMEQPLTAHRDGTVAGLDVAGGQLVRAGQVLLELTD
jgi:acetyl-CoA/propionyl-CoA carboxylase biotin carboxyl carrier protein